MKNSKLILVFCAIILSYVTLSQQVIYFDSVYHFTPWNYWDFARSVVEIGDGYIIQGETSDQYYTSWHRIGFSKIDTLGNQIWAKSYGDTISQWGLARSGCFIKSSSGGFYAVGYTRTPTGNWVFDQGLIMRFDENLDTLWTRLYGEKTEPVDTSYMLKQVKQLENNDLIIVGLAYPYGETSRIYLLKTDSLGNKLWDKWLGFGDTWFFYAFSIIQTSDNGFAIGGSVNYWPDAQGIDPIVIKTDSLGNQEWIKYLGGPIRDHQAYVTLSHDNQILAGMNIGYTQYGSTGYSGRICIVKMDNDGNIFWNKEYSGDYHTSRLNSLISLPDGYIVATGNYRKDYPHTIGWILKVNSFGDSVWIREYDRYSLSEDSKYKLYDIKTTSDGGLIACGDAAPHEPDPGNQDAWVIKLDSIGCDTPNCDPTVIMPIDIAYRGSIEVFPNPADKQFVVRCSPDNYREFVEGNCIIQLFDLYGRKVKEIKVPKGKEQIIIDIEGWQKGLYLLRISSGDGFSESVKVVVE